MSEQQLRAEIAGLEQLTANQRTVIEAFERQKVSWKTENARFRALCDGWRERALSAEAELHAELRKQTDLEDNIRKLRAVAEACIAERQARKLHHDWPDSVNARLLCDEAVGAVTRELRKAGMLEDKP